MDDLVSWLRAQLDADERVARMVTPGPWVTNGTAVWRRPDDSWDFRRAVEGRHGRMPFVVVDVGETDEPQNAEHIATWDPARVLAEVDAKRQIVDEHAVRGGTCSACSWQDAPCTTVRLLALPYADRDGYREEWRP